MKIRAIERLRGIAIVTVYLIHVQLFGDAFGYFKPLRRIATWTGVDLFFVISGFVVTLSLERLLPERPRQRLRDPLSMRDGHALRSFYIRRFFRLAPMAVCALALHLVGSVVGSRYAATTPFLSPREWAFEASTIVFGIYNFVAPFLGKIAMAFFWTLNVEEQFYVLLPILFVAAGTRRGRTVAAAAVLGAVAMIIRPVFSPDAFQIAHCSSQYRFDALAAGVVLALQRERLTAVVSHVPSWARRAAGAAALLVLVFATHFLPGPFTIHGGLIVIWASAACLVGLAYTDGDDVLAIPIVGRALEHVGSRSYAIYVLHTAFLFLDETVRLAAPDRWRVWLAGMTGQTLRFSITAVLVLAASEVAHRYIERPSMALGKKYAARSWSPVPAVVSTAT